jgi:hypothetical protein
MYTGRVFLSGEPVTQFWELLSLMPRNKTIQLLVIYRKKKKGKVVPVTGLEGP